MGCGSGRRVLGHAEVLQRAINGAVSGEGVSRSPDPTEIPVLLYHTFNPVLLPEDGFFDSSESRRFMALAPVRGEKPPQIRDAPEEPVDLPKLGARFVESPFRAPESWLKTLELATPSQRQSNQTNVDAPRVQCMRCGRHFVRRAPLDVRVGQSGLRLHARPIWHDKSA